MYPCKICNFLPVILEREICEVCVKEHGQFNRYGKLMEFFVIDQNIYSRVNGRTTQIRECYISQIPCYASCIKGKLVFKQIKEIPENKRHFKFCTYY